MVKDRLGGKRTLKVGDFLDEYEKDDIKKQVDILKLFKHFGAKPEKKGNNWVARCIFGKHEDKTPSLFIDSEKGLYNCFGCGCAGDHFTLVMTMKECSFKEALQFLKGFSGKGFAPAVLKRKEKKETETRQDKNKPGMTAVSLDIVTDFYHKKLYENKSGIHYLTKTRKIDPALIKRFKIGYAEGSLLKIVSNGQKEALKTLNILKTTEKGRTWEFFTGCLTFPIFDETGKVVHIYGRKADTEATKPHLYLSGSHRSIFNRQASRVYDTIILVESVIDCLSLITMGFENVQPLYGAGTLTEEHIKILKGDRVKTIVLALDNDPAGRKGAEKHKKTLIKEGFGVKVIFPPDVKDWNNYLLAGGNKDQVNELIAGAPEDKLKPEPAKAEDFKITKQANTYQVQTRQLIYRIILIKESYGDFKVNIKVTYGQGESFPDRVDLYSARSRESYAVKLSTRTGIPESRIEKDLLLIFDYLEEEQRKKFETNDTKENIIVVTETEKKEGLTLLTNPKTEKQITNAFNLLGYVGEEVNSLLVFFAAITRLLDNPLSIYIQADSSAGKSALLETLASLLPPEALLNTSSFSRNALYYFEEDAFLHKVFMIGEAIHEEEVEGQIRKMQSEHEISRSVTEKNEKTGEMTVRHVKKEVRLSFMMTSTALHLNPENASRCLMLHVDESKAQTNRVQENMKKWEGDIKNQFHLEFMQEQVKKQFIAAQRMLEKYRIYNPIAPYITFPITRPTMRRALKHFLTLILGIGLWRQKIKEPRELLNPYTKEKIPVLPCTLTDYDIAQRLYNEGIIKLIKDGLPVGAVNLYEEIRAMLQHAAKKENLSPLKVTCTQKQVRGFTGLGADTVKKYIKLLADYEYLKIIAGKRNGIRNTYALMEDKPIEEIDMAVLPAAAEIAERMKKDGKTPEW